MTAYVPTVQCAAEDWRTGALRTDWEEDGVKDRWWMLDAATATAGNWHCLLPSPCCCLNDASQRNSTRPSHRENSNLIKDAVVLKYHHTKQPKQKTSWGTNAIYLRLTFIKCQRKFLRYVRNRWILSRNHNYYKYCIRISELCHPSPNVSIYYRLTCWMTLGDKKKSTLNIHL